MLVDTNGRCSPISRRKPGRRSAAKLLTRDEARRIAANIAKLPELPAPKLLGARESSLIPLSAKGPPRPLLACRCARQLPLLARLIGAVLRLTADAGVL